MIYELLTFPVLPRR